MGAVHLTSKGKESDVWDPHVSFSFLKSLFSPYMFIRRQNKADARYFIREFVQYNFKYEFGFKC